MHSSRMRTVRCSGRRGGGACIPACTGQGGMYPSMHWAGGVYRSMHWAGGVSARGCLPEGVSATPPPLDRMTDACENITLPQLRCGR